MALPPAGSSRAQVQSKRTTTVGTTTSSVPTSRPGTSRSQTATPALGSGRATPTNGVRAQSQVPKSPKRKAPESEHEAGGEETNINVVVRCRGRNDREVRENSGVVVSTEGVKGKKVELSMGPSALSNKTYAFDKVFSPAADQQMLFDEVVSPILDEVLGGFNCTIFAYGQTGTGKTYTMSGDISDVLPIPDAAGIIPRVLHALFDRLGDDEAAKSENSVKCSFIELYNEELRDLLAVDDTSKLKIFDEANKNGRATTMVQGMEETHIQSARKGIQLLREGSHKRQVAATKCNDLSSRSHTVFTVTVYMKRTSDAGEDFVSAGKLNLVDLAGSENIQRSGAENKRAAEAGLINKSLLTLGRVINALVDKSSHIPYRESKLTRLLQDSLGGRTKTCIVATLSPAKSNLEETISTLDYAFRAKNIRNKPQVNQMVSKKTLFKEFTSEIEKLKSELIATRQRNGVYLTSEAYEELTTESESRRILSEEQKDKIETIEGNLRNRIQELFTLTTTFQTLKKDNEQTRLTLDGTKSVLEKTEVVLAHTRKSLAEEAQLRKAHEETEAKLTTVGHELIGTLGTTTDHVERLHSKLRRRSDLQAANRDRWADSQQRVVGATETVEQRVEALRQQQGGMLASLSNRMQSFVSDELAELQSSKAFLQAKSEAFKVSESEVHAQTVTAKDELNGVLEEIKTLRDDVKQKVGAGLDDLSAAAQRISAGIANELDVFHSQLQSSYVSLGREFKTIFEDLIRRMNEQQSEAQRLRAQIAAANDAFVASEDASQDQLARAVEDERLTAAVERGALIQRMAAMIHESSAAQEARLSGFVDMANKRLKTSQDEFRLASQIYGMGMDDWNGSFNALVETSVRGRDTIKSKLKADWSMADSRTTSLVETTQAVHGETVRIVNGQMEQMDGQLVALDEIVSRVRAQNETHHEAHTASLQRLAGDVQESYGSISKHFETSYDRTTSLQSEMQAKTDDMRASLRRLDEGDEIREPLQTLRANMSQDALQEYQITGQTPAKMQYTYSTTLPRTEAHETLLDRMRGGTSETSAPDSEMSTAATKTSPSGMPTIYADSPGATNTSSIVQAPADSSMKPPSLQERDINIPTVTMASESVTHELAKPTLKRYATDQIVAGSKLPMKRSARMTVVGLAEGRENALEGAANLSASVGPGGRRALRARGSN